MKIRLRWSPKTEAAVLPPARPGRPPVVLPPLPKVAPPAAIANSTGTEEGIIGKLMIEAYGASDPGCVRGNNEDYYLVAPSIGL